MASAKRRSTVTEDELSLVIKLLKKDSSLPAVSSFLKRRNLSHSAGSWDQMRNERLAPALQRGDLDRNDLLQLVRDAEEYGRQHVFLFRCPKIEAAELTSEEMLRNRLQRMGSLDLMDTPRLVDTPPGLQAVEARLEPSSSGNHLVIKFIDVRRYMQQLSKEMDGDVQVVRSRPQLDRAVNIFRLSPSGIAEVRIQAHRNSLEYPDHVEAVFAKLAGYTDRLKYEDFSLSKSRRYLLENRSKLSSSIRFGAGTIRSKKGAPVTFASSDWKENLFNNEDQEIEAAMSTLLAAGGGRSACDIVNCTWLKGTGDTELGSDVHTYIAGKSNQCYVVTRCDRADYLYVLGKILSFAR